VIRRWVVLEMSKSSAVWSLVTAMSMVVDARERDEASETTGLLKACTIVK
jgi:hypothetical protein